MLKERLEKELHSALKDRNVLKVSVIRMVLSVIKNLEIKKQVANLEDKDIISIIRQSIKQHKDSIDHFKKAKREDLVKKEQQELEILQAYLPPQLTKEELIPIVKEVIQTCGASTKAQMGMVMKILLEKVGERAEGKLINEVVREFLK